MRVRDICHNKCCNMQVNKACGRRSRSEARGQQAGSKGHTLDIVTFTAELSSENKPLRWTAFSLILLLWNSLACCAWAFLCRVTWGTRNKGSAISPVSSPWWGTIPPQAPRCVRVHAVHIIWQTNSRLTHTTLLIHEILQFSLPRREAGLDSSVCVVRATMTSVCETEASLLN